VALNASILAALIKTKRLAKLDASQIVNNDALDDDCAAIAEAVIEHIVALAVVTVPPGVAVTVAVPAGTGATIAPGVGTIS
jgi:hypothetical protein